MASELTDDWRLREEHRAVVNLEYQDYLPEKRGFMLHAVGCFHNIAGRELSASVVEELFALERERTDAGLPRSFFFSETCLVTRAAT